MRKLTLLLLFLSTGSVTQWRLQSCDMHAWVFCDAGLSLVIGTP
jgi:hypothetical protein